jgi:hypothetical protein
MQRKSAPFPEKQKDKKTNGTPLLIRNKNSANDDRVLTNKYKLPQRDQKRDNRNLLC